MAPVLGDQDLLTSDVSCFLEDEACGYVYGAGAVHSWDEGVEECHCEEAWDIFQRFHRDGGAARDADEKQPVSALDLEEPREHCDDLALELALGEQCDRNK